MLNLSIAQQLTVADIIRGKNLDYQAHWLYIIADQIEVLYVGYSQYPTQRVLEHTGLILSEDGRTVTKTIPTSAIGHAAMDNIDVSKHWQVFFPTLEECLPTVDEYNSLITEQYQRLMQTEFSQPAKWAEVALIAKYRPPYNTANNPNPNPIPNRYTKHSNDQKFISELLGNLI